MLSPLSPFCFFRIKVKVVENTFLVMWQTIRNVQTRMSKEMAMARRKVNKQQQQQTANRHGILFQTLSCIIARTSSQFFVMN